MTCVSADDLDCAAELAHGMLLTASPFREWLVGLLLQFMVVLQLVQLEDLMRQREGLLAIYRRFAHDLDAMYRHRDCAGMLHHFVLPTFAAVFFAVHIPLLLLGLIDLFIFSVTGISAYSLGIVHVYRRAAGAMLCILLAPYLYQEGYRTWRIVHDALRDERYLVGKRLHNMDRAQRRLAQQGSSVF